eukprot:6157866-Pyramimonas_sp.AAC.1
MEEMLKAKAAFKSAPAENTKPEGALNNAVSKSGGGGSEGGSEGGSFRARDFVGVRICPRVRWVRFGPS